MNVLCLGCSWTAGVNIQPYNWVTALSELMPEHTFYNCAQSGGSLLYSIWIMEEFLANAKNGNNPIKIDKIIFQITTEGRLTYHHDTKDFNINKWLITKSNNLYQYEFDWRNLATINYGTLLPENESNHHPHWNSIVTFSKDYYSRLTRKQHFDLEHRALVEYIRLKADGMFLHRTDDIGISDIISMEDVLGSKQFNEYIVDNGHHFSIDGARWQAAYIKTLFF